MECKNACKVVECVHDMSCPHKWCVSQYTDLGPQFCCKTRKNAHAKYDKVSILEKELRKAHMEIERLKTEIDFMKYTS